MSAVYLGVDLRNVNSILSTKCIQLQHVSSTRQHVNHSKQNINGIHIETKLLKTGPMGICVERTIFLQGFRIQSPKGKTEYWRVGRILSDTVNTPNVTSVHENDETIYTCGLEFALINANWRKLCFFAFLWGIKRISDEVRIFVFGDVWLQIVATCVLCLPLALR